MKKTELLTAVNLTKLDAMNVNKRLWSRMYFVGCRKNDEKDSLTVPPSFSLVNFYERKFFQLGLQIFSSTSFANSAANYVKLTDVLTYFLNVVVHRNRRSSSVSIRSNTRLVNWHFVQVLRFKK